ncbi:MAG: hypothetical protein PHX85_03320 [Methanobacteriaceae archaeon]|nr:hypothetical protein [Methanobacteriaceae archaeon]
MTNKNTKYYRKDLRNQSNFHDYFFFNGYNLNSCISILLIITLLLFCVMAVSATPNPNVIFGI